MKILPLLTLMILINLGNKAYAEETKPLVFVNEYIRELAELESIREETQNDLSDSQNTLSACIQHMTSFQLELNSQISMLNGMHLNPPYESVIPTLISLNKTKVSLYTEYADACSAMAAGPKPNVDYQQYAAELPKVTAKLDYVDKTIFEASALVFATLTDSKEDSHHHCNHLIITKAERDKLIEDINLFFGEKLKQKNRSVYVSSAEIIKDGLEKGFKGSDESWE